VKPAIALAVVVGVLVPTVGLAEAFDTSAGSNTAAPKAATAPLVGTRLVCPDAADRTAGHVSRVTRIGVAAPQTSVPAASSASAAAARGTVTVSRLPVRGLPPVQVQMALAPGAAQVLAGGAFQGDVVIDATGGLAPGISADEFGRRDGGTYRGLDSVACTAPVDSAWLVGASTTIGAHGQLRVTNTDDSIALIDIALFGPRGPVTARNAVGLAVPAHSTRLIALETVAPAQSLLMVNVRARSGRVAIALRQQLQNASTPNGQDWVPITSAPARSALVPGLIAGQGPRRVLVGNPGDTDATASFRLIRGDSSFVPRGFSAVTVPAGSTIAVDLTKALGGRAGAVLVSADRPVAAGAAMSSGPGRISGFAEVAYSGAVPPLSGPASVVINYAHFRTSQLYLTAPSGAADVAITTLAGIGPGPARQISVHVPAGRTVVYDLTALTRGALLVSVALTPVAGGGPVYAARHEIEVGSHGPMFTLLPLTSAPQVALVPPAALDLRAGLPQ
jgi:hypothetical protein